MSCVQGGQPHDEQKRVSAPVYLAGLAAAAQVLILPAGEQTCHRSGAIHLKAYQACSTISLRLEEGPLGYSLNGHRYVGLWVQTSHFAATQLLAAAPCWQVTHCFSHQPTCPFCGIMVEATPGCTLPAGPALAETSAADEALAEAQQLVSELQQTAEHMASALRAVGIEVALDVGPSVKDLPAPQEVVGDLAEAQLLAEESSPAPQEPASAIVEVVPVADSMPKAQEAVAEIAEAQPAPADPAPEAQKPAAVVAEAQPSAADSAPKPEEPAVVVAEAQPPAAENATKPQEPAVVVAEAQPPAAESAAEPPQPAAVVAEAQPPAAEGAAKPQEPAAVVATADSIPEPQEAVGTIAEAVDSPASLEGAALEAEAGLAAAAVASVEPTEVAAAVEKQPEVGDREAFCTSARDSQGPT